MSTAVLSDLWRLLGGAAGAVERVTLTGGDTLGLPSSFRVGAAAETAIALAAMAAAERYRRLTGITQSITVDRLAACLECRSERYMLIDGKPGPELMDPLATVYPCGDGRLVRLHTNFPHHRDGLVALLGAEPARQSIAAKLLMWDAAAFEQAATERGFVVAMLRTFAEWDAHPQSTAIRTLPLISIRRIGDAPPGRSRQALAEPLRPLSGLRVLEMTRIIAGPVGGRTLAAHGADVLRVIGPDVPTLPLLDLESGRGKRSAHVDLGTTDGFATLRHLISGADIVLQSYRPGVFDRFGLSPGAMAELCPGVVVGSLSAYGTSGPWAGKRGFDSLVQAATGFNMTEAEAAGSDNPKVLPMQILDHASGHLLAAGLILARLRQETEGGSWHVEVALARTGEWLRTLGRLPDGLAMLEPTPDAVAAHLEARDTPNGRVETIRHAARMSVTPANWVMPARHYGADRPEWTADS